MPNGSVFSQSQADFTTLLRRVANDWTDAKVLTARNFLLDENVLLERYESYAAANAAIDHGNSTNWQTAHEKYLSEAINRPGHGGTPGSAVDSNDPDVCSETFRHIDPNSPYQWADDRLHLIRVEQLRFVADRAGETPERVKQLVEQYIARGDSDTDNRDQLAAVLDTWISQVDSRPVFATFWNDVCDLFGDSPERDSQDWADELRDRLGLLHLNPASRGGTPIEVLVFRYPIADTPLLRGVRDRRPIVPPTVLDGRFSPPFCPAPRGEKTGFVVHLQGESVPLRQEVLHPRLAFKPKHVWRLGMIRRSITGDIEALKLPRGLHLGAVREHAGRGDYAVGTDGDLLT
jgi:hypothetical protein